MQIGTTILHTFWSNGPAASDIKRYFDHDMFNPEAVIHINVFYNRDAKHLIQCDHKWLDTVSI